MIGIEYLNCECPICHKKFHLKPSQIKKTKNNYCSRECHREAKKIYMAGSKNHQYGKKGHRNASWKSDVKESRYGYVQIRVLDHPFRDGDDFVFEHRLVAEKYLLNDENSLIINGKRYLSPKYVVHHIDFDRKNNSVDNLMVMTKKDHQRLHCSLNQAKRNERSGRFEKDNDNILHARKTTETAKLPTRATDGSAGYDLYVDSDKEITIKAHETVMCTTGLAFSIPRGYVGLIFGRSGKATKEGVRPATCVSVIDSDYRGNVGLPMHNDSDEDRIIKPYERVAQMIITKYETPELVLVDKLDETERGDNGFGSTGR